MKGSRWAAATSLVSAVLLMIGLTVVASSASASAPPTPKATGSVAMAYNPLGPLYASFSAFGGATPKGSVTYTNFASGGTGSHVWNLDSEVHFVLLFDLYGEREHTMNLSSVTALSPKSIAFTGTGYNNGYQGTYDWSAHGTVNSSVIPATFTMDLVYTDANSEQGKTAHLSGTIAGDGSMGGSLTSDWGTGTWTGASAFEVVSYTAAVTCASVDASVTPRVATFGFTIPDSPVDFPGLSGVNVVAHVTDNGTPALSNDSPPVVNDTWAHGQDDGYAACTGPYVDYPITSGNIVVH